MSYQVLARRYRPATFSEVVGQATVTRTLQNAIGAGRIGHAFLFSGARGVGKTTTARILAKALNCVSAPGPTPEPCLKCSSCEEIARGSSLDVQEIDGASNNGVDSVRELRESARYNPARDRFKIWIIDEVHMLSAGAVHALLTTLEEPPPRVKFIFATTEYHKIPETILSRCQQYDFRMVPTREIAGHLREVATKDGIRVSDQALEAIARAGEGSVRDALSLFDQVLSFSGSEVKDQDLQALLGLIDRELLFAASEAVLAGDSLRLLEAVDRLSEYGADYRNFARELQLHFRDILLARLAPADSALRATSGPDAAKRLEPLAEAFSEEDVVRVLDVLVRAESDLRWSPDPRVTLELALLKLVQLRRLVPFAELVARVEGFLGGKAPAPRLLAPEPRPAPAPAPRPQAAPAAAPDAAAIVSSMAAAARPSLAPALRAASARLEDGALVLDVPADFRAFAEAHLDDLKALARSAAGERLPVRLAAPSAPPAEPVAPAEEKRQRLRERAEREPAVQEALDLFGGRVVDVREAK
ncbi:MAG TPA: DNA polymerase III subunit gamma/tau [Vicinamibacteria bacterium]|nr:DNA polymerase III subunit gamma/tau [Vicinamibacteria bacterium]